MNFRSLLGVREWLLVFLALSSIIGQVFLDLLVPDLMQGLSTQLASSNISSRAIVGEGLLMLGAALGSLSLAVVTGFCTARVGTTLARNLRLRVFAHTFRLSGSQVNALGADTLITRTTHDVMQIQTFLVVGFQMMIKSPIMAFWASSKIASQSLAWSVPTAVAVVATIVTLVTLIGLVMPRMIRMQQLTDQLNRVTREHLGGMRVLRAYTTQAFHRGRFEAVNDDLRRNTLFINSGFAFLMPLLTAIMNLLTLAIYALGAQLISQAGSTGEKTLLFGQMIAFSSYALQVISAFMMLAVVFIFAPRAWVSYKRIREVLRQEPDVQDGPGARPLSAAPALSFEEVSFRYPGAEADAVHRVSFTLERGQTLAIIGSTGSGKTSLINLIPRFASATGGTVRVAGHRVEDYTQQELRQLVGFVPQENYLFSGTVASTIAFSQAQDQDAASRVVEAARLAQASDFIEATTEAYAHTVSSGGKNFSGGQRQRLAIARALAYDAPILVFDDSFSALDYKTDSLIRKNLRELAGQKTIIIVAQRIGTIKNADKILVLDRGRTVGFGTHTQLLASNPVYQEIAHSQLTDQELA